MSRTGQIIVSAIVLAALAYYLPALLPIAALVIILLMANGLDRR